MISDIINSKVNLSTDLKEILFLRNPATLYRDDQYIAILQSTQVQLKLYKTKQYTQLTTKTTQISFPTKFTNQSHREQHWQKYDLFFSQSCIQPVSVSSIFHAMHMHACIVIPIWFFDLWKWLRMGLICRYVTIVNPCYLLGLCFVIPICLLFLNYNDWNVGEVVSYPNC